MLKDDSHFLRILRQQARGELHALGLRQECNVEMMLAGQSMFGGVREHMFQYAAQRVAREDIITNVIGRHYLVLQKVVWSNSKVAGSPDPSVRLAAGSMLSGHGPQVSTCKRQIADILAHRNACGQ